MPPPQPSLSLACCATELMRPVLALIAMVPIATCKLQQHRVSLTGIRDRPFFCVVFTTQLCSWWFERKHYAQILVLVCQSPSSQRKGKNDWRAMLVLLLAKGLTLWRLRRDRILILNTLYGLVVDFDWYENTINLQDLVDVNHISSWSNLAPRYKHKIVACERWLRL